MNVYGIVPICAICNKPVDNVSKWRDDIRHRDVYEVECHQKRKEYHIYDYDLRNTKCLIIDKAFIEESEMKKKAIQVL